MREDQTSITLGGRQFTLPALTLDQLQDLVEPLKNCDPLTKEGIGCIKQVLAVSLAGQLADPLTEMGAMNITLEELWDAQQKLAEVSALRPLLDRLAEKFRASQLLAKTAG